MNTFTALALASIIQFPLDSDLTVQDKIDWAAALQAESAQYTEQYIHPDSGETCFYLDISDVAEINADMVQEHTVCGFDLTERAVFFNGLLDAIQIARGIPLAIFYAQ